MKELQVSNSKFEKVSLMIMKNSVVASDFHESWNECRSEVVCLRYSRICKQAKVVVHTIIIQNMLWKIIQNFTIGYTRIYNTICLYFVPMYLCFGQISFDIPFNVIRQELTQIYYYNRLCEVPEAQLNFSTNCYKVF